MNFFELLRGSRAQQIKDLKEEIDQLKQKLEERQEAINKTNAYWKKKLHEVQRKQASK